jgi:hypothetical protein
MVVISLPQLMFVPYGTRVYYQFTSDQTSLFQTSFWVTDGFGNKIGQTMYAGSKGGSDYNYFDSQGTYYVLHTQCGDESSLRCSGEGRIYYYK